MTILCSIKRSDHR